MTTMTVDRKIPGTLIATSALAAGAVLGGAGALWLRHGTEIFMTYATGLGVICM